MARGVKKEEDVVVINDSSEVMAADLLQFRTKMINLGEKLADDLMQGRSRNVQLDYDMVIRLYQALNA